MTYKEHNGQNVLQQEYRRSCRLGVRGVIDHTQHGRISKPSCHPQSDFLPVDVGTRVCTRSDHERSRVRVGCYYTCYEERGGVIYIGPRRSGAQSYEYTPTRKLARQPSKHSQFLHIRSAIFLGVWSHLLSFLDCGCRCIAVSLSSPAAIVIAVPGILLFISCALQSGTITTRRTRHRSLLARDRSALTGTEQ